MTRKMISISASKENPLTVAWPVLFLTEFFFIFLFHELRDPGLKDLLIIAERMLPDLTFIKDHQR